MRLAVVEETGVVSVAAVRDGSYAVLAPAEDGDLGVVIAGGAQALEELGRRLAELPAAAWRPLGGARFRLPVTRPGKVVCLGLNYADHAREGGNQVPDYPAFFMRGPTSLVPAGGPILRPRVSETLDFEAELMVVIGRRGRGVTEDQALDLVFGYTCFNDGSVRDFQRKSAQWTPGKNFDSTGAVGPVVVTPDELPRGAVGLSIASRLNGRTMQSADTADMLVSVTRAIALIAEFTTLEPGDLIAMGTPQGVGYARQPPVWMRPGDLVEIEIEGIGILANPVADEGETH